MARASTSDWAMLQIHTHQPDAAYLDDALDVGRRLLELQQPDGSTDLSDSPGFASSDVASPRTFSETCERVLTAIALGNGGA